MKISFITLLLLSLLMLTASAQERGKASYYADKFQGKPTASGEKYDKNKFTAAHRTLPFGAIVKVTNLKNNKSVNVKINDMGPHNLSRVIDLSGAAADAIDMKTDGVVEVQLDVIAEYPSEASPKVNLGPASGGAAPASAATQRTSQATGQAAPGVVIDMTQDNTNKITQPASSSAPILLPNILPGQSSGLTQSAQRVSAPGNPAMASGANLRTAAPASAQPTSTKGLGLFRFTAFRAAADGYGIQVGAYADYRNVLEIANQLVGAGMQDLMIHTKVEEGKDVFRLIIGPFPSRGATESYQSQLQSIGMKGYVVVLKDL
jgi:rare lipoprotein A